MTVSGVLIVEGVAVVVKLETSCFLNFAKVFLFCNSYYSLKLTGPHGISAKHKI